MTDSWVGYTLTWPSGDAGGEQIEQMPRARMTWKSGGIPLFKAHRTPRALFSSFLDGFDTSAFVNSPMGLEV